MTSSIQEKLSICEADNGRGRWTQLLESVCATRLLSSTVIYCKHTLILREICHNIKWTRCFPPVLEAFPCPLGHPVKHREICSMSYSHHSTLQRERGWKELGWKSQHWASWTCRFGLCNQFYVSHYVYLCVVSDCRDKNKTRTTAHSCPSTANWMVP